MKMADGSRTTAGSGLPLALRVEAATAALVVAVAVVGIALWPLTTAVCVRTLVTVVGSEELSGLDREDTLATAVAVLRFVTDRQAPDLPARVGSVAGFDSDAVSHLIDVRNVLIPARTLALVAAALACAWCVLRARTLWGRQAVGAALRGAGWLLVGTGGIALLAGALDFDAFFAAFHSLFFAAGTWVFPADALLIRLFPLPFWITAGAMWAALVLVAAVLLIVFGTRLRFTSECDGV